MSLHYTIFVVFVILLVILDGSQTAYTPHLLGEPVAAENFDPAEADPVGNITCLGDSYDLELPLQAHWNPNTVSMQSLCAKTQYGGGPPGQNIAGWCEIPPRSRGYLHPSNPGTIAFDASPGAHANAQLQNPRVMLGCLYRCFCSNGVEELSLQRLSLQPKTYRSTDIFGIHTATPEVDSDTAYQVKIDVVDDFFVPQEQHMGPPQQPAHPGVVVATVLTQTQVELQAGNPRELEVIWVSLDPDNNITCIGNLPTFNLPAPYQISQYGSLQELCAVYGSGGNLDANAGGYCHRSVGGNGQEQGVVWFSDEMTPRLNWTWAGGDFFAAASIRFYCWQRCACDSNPTRDNITTNLWLWLNNHELVQKSDGSIDDENHSDSDDSFYSATSDSLEILPPQDGPSSSSGTCGSDGNQFCPYAWNATYFGSPPPQTPPNATDIEVAIGSKNNNLTVCGNHCQGPQDCWQSTPDTECNCALPFPDDAHTLGIDPIFPQAVCLVLSTLVVSGMLGTRDNPEYVNRRGEPYRCLCNATFIAPECCGSKDGIIYLR